jgi:hypothetical protein
VSLTERRLSNRPLDRDTGLLGQLDGLPFRPIFIMGMHRSGTTYLYESLARVLPVAALTLYQTLFFDELLYRRANGFEEAGQAAVDDYLRAAGMMTRQFDDVPVSHRALDEYCFMLRRRSGTAHVEQKSATTFAELCRKLSFMGGVQDVLLKNPWDVALAVPIYRLFPNARFVFIKRDLLRVLDSQARMLCHILERDMALMSLVLRQIPRDRLVIQLMSKLYKVLGAHRFRLLFLPLAEREMHRLARALEQSLRELPGDCFCQLEYEQLVADPTSNLERVARFLDVTPVRPVASIGSQPRSLSLLPEVEARASRFLARLAV